MTTNTVKIKTGTVFTFRSASYSPTAINDIDPAGSTTVDLTLSSIVAGAAKHSDQFDFGEPRGQRYSLKAAIEWFAAVTSGGTVDFYMVYSNNATVTDGLTGREFTDGVDGAVVTTNATVAEFVAQLHYVGSFVNNGYAGVQIADCGIFSPRDRYGSLVVVNNTDATLCGTDDIESCIVMSELNDDIQAAA